MSTIGYSACYHCKDRKAWPVNCHTTCESYLKEVEEGNRIKEIARNNPPIYITQGSFVGNAVKSSKHKVKNPDRYR